MTSELVERLRKYPKPERCNNIFRKTSENAHEAADEIERLRAALRFWCEAYRSGQHEPLVAAYESTVAKFPALEERT